MTLVTITCLSTQDITLPAGITHANIFLVGGGGPGGNGLSSSNSCGTGGRAGEQKTVTLVAVSAGTYHIVVGHSGEASTGLGESASPGAAGVTQTMYQGQPGANGYTTIAGNAQPGQQNPPTYAGAAGSGRGAGGGGGGCLTNFGPGGAGSDGVVIITYYQPDITFSGTPAEDTAPADVVFSASASESPTGWLWSFGDGESSSSQNPTHTYNLPGKFTVALTVTNAYGIWPLIKTDYISMYWVPVTHSYIITADPYRGA